MVISLFSWFVSNDREGALVLEELSGLAEIEFGEVLSEIVSIWRCSTVFSGEFFFISLVFVVVVVADGTPSADNGISIGYMTHLKKR